MDISTLTLERTAKAVADYDAHEATGVTLLLTVEQWNAWQRTLDELTRKVGEAFALDTADHDSPENAKLMHPRDPWLREILKNRRRSG